MKCRADGILNRDKTKKKVYVEWRGLANKP